MDVGSDGDRASKIKLWSWMAREIVMPLTEMDYTEDREAKTDAEI